MMDGIQLRSLGRRSSAAFSLGGTESEGDVMINRFGLKDNHGSSDISFIVFLFGYNLTLVVLVNLIFSRVILKKPLYAVVATSLDGKRSSNSCIRIGAAYWEI